MDQISSTIQSLEAIVFVQMALSLDISGKAQDGFEQNGGMESNSTKVDSHYDSSFLGSTRRYSAWNKFLWQFLCSNKAN